MTTTTAHLQHIYPWNGSKLSINSTLMLINDNYSTSTTHLPLEANLTSTVQLLGVDVL